MAKKSRIQPTGRAKDSSNEAMRILASLIAQFHVKKITRDKKQQIQDTDFGEMDNGQNLS